ncbi:MAG: hypothetical protein ACP6IQ_09335 [Candidatus Njordarchaeia archaeon]
MVLQDQLQNIIEEAIKLSNSWKNAGKIGKSGHLYMRHEVYKIEYKEGEMRVHDEFPVIKKKEWRDDDIAKLVGSLKDKPLFRNLIKLIAERYNLDVFRSEFLLSQLLQKVVTESLDREINLEKIKEYVGLFIKDLEGKPIEWKIKVWLVGILMDVEEIEIEKGVIIRRPNPSDFEWERPYPVLTRGPPAYPTAILEIKKQLEIHSYVYPEIEKMILTLQLYRVGSVKNILIEWEPKSILQSKGARGSSRKRWSSIYKYTLDENDKEKLPKFVSKIKDKLPTETETGRLITSCTIGAAISQYIDALTSLESISHKINYTITGLKYLFFKKGENERDSHRFAQRIAKILDLSDEELSRIYHFIEKSYNLKPQFIYDFSTKIELSEENKDILDSLIEYLRRAILVFLQMNEDQKYLLTLADKAASDMQAEQMLHDLTNKRVETLGG